MRVSTYLQTASLGSLINRFSRLPNLNVLSRLFITVVGLLEMVNDDNVKS